MTERTPPALSNATPRPIDGKFAFHDGEIVNLVSGEIIPRDEPLFLLRARDTFSVGLLNHYRTMCNIECNDLHLKGIDQVMDKFAMFQLQHPERVKQPGKTRHLKLDAAPPVAEGPATPRLCPRCLGSGNDPEDESEIIEPKCRECKGTGAAPSGMSREQSIDAYNRKYGGSREWAAAAEPFTPNAVEGRAAAPWVPEQSQIAEHPEIAVAMIKGLQCQLDEARRELTVLRNIHGESRVSLAIKLESAEAANQELRRWLPISEAPRTGEHILVTSLTDSWGTCGGKKQRPHAIVHWFDDAFYLSLGNQDEPQNWPTHFKSLDDSAALLGPQHGQDTIHRPPPPSDKCPDCGSERFYCRGMNKGFKCRNCGKNWLPRGPQHGDTK